MHVRVFTITPHSYAGHIAGVQQVPGQAIRDSTAVGAQGGDPGCLLPQGRVVMRDCHSRGLVQDTLPRTLQIVP